MLRVLGQVEELFVRLFVSATLRVTKLQSRMSHVYLRVYSNKGGPEGVPGGVGGLIRRGSNVAGPESRKNICFKRGRSMASFAGQATPISALSTGVAAGVRGGLRESSLACALRDGAWRYSLA